MLKIDEVTIKGFKKIKKAKVELSPGANLLLGHNETGKTSLRDAIIYALTDAILGQPKGSFVEVLNDQCKTASVAITGQAGTKPFDIKRTLAKTNRSGPSAVQVGAQLGVDPDILSACLNANYYFDLPPADQKKLIIKALGLKPTKKDAVDALAKAGRAAESWNNMIIQEIGSFGWDAGHKIAYDLRREAGQAKKILEGERPKLIQYVSMDGKDVPIEAILATHKETPLEEQEKAHKKRLAGLYEELGGIKALSKADKEVAEKQLAEHRVEKARFEAQPQWTGEDSTKAKQLKIAKKKYDAKTKEDVAALEGLIDTAENLLTENRKNWKSDLACPISDQSGHKMCPAVEPDWSGQQKEIDGLTAKIQAIEEKGFPEQDIWDALSEKAVTCKYNIVQREILEKDIEDLEKTLENAAPEAGEKKEALGISIKTIEEKLNNLSLAHHAIHWNQATQETLDATQAKIEDAEAKREHYDKLCGLLAPGGIPGELVAEKLGVLNARLKEHSEILGVEVIFAEDLSLMQPKGKPLWVLGGSEQAQARMMVAEALSYCSGIGLLLLDETNISVAESAKRVQKWLIKIAGENVQVVACAATNAAGPPKIPENASCRVFWVSKGQIKQL